MALFGAFDKTKHLSELGEPLVSQEGVITPSERKGRMRQSMNVLDQGTGAPASYATVGAQTYTAADILTGIIVRDCAGASRSDVLPTAANLVAAIPHPFVGQVLSCLIVNGSDAAEVITIGAGSGGAFDTNQVAASRIIPQNASKTIRIRITNVGTPAYVVYV